MHQNHDKTYENIRTISMRNMVSVVEHFLLVLVRVGLGELDEFFTI
jgi:hypothetical protein